MLFLIKLEPVLLHYRFLLKQQSSLVGSLINDIYIIGATDERREMQFLECWEFLLIIENVEPEKFNKAELKELFYKHADLSVEQGGEQVISMNRFAKLCMMKNLLSKRAQKNYFKKHKIGTSFQFDQFATKFRTDYMVGSA